MPEIRRFARRASGPSDAPPSCINSLHRSSESSVTWRRPPRSALPTRPRPRSRTAARWASMRPPFARLMKMATREGMRDIADFRHMSLQRDLLAERAPCAGQVIAERQCEDDTHPVESGNHSELDEACAVLHVHEVEDDNQGLEAGDREGRDGIQRSEIEVGYSHCDARHHEENRKDPVVDFHGNDVVLSVCVLSHVRAYPCRPIRYRSGNRKIQTMSTKCQ